VLLADYARSPNDAGLCQLSVSLALREIGNHPLCVNSSGVEYTGHRKYLADAVWLWNTFQITHN
jgi:hypothetical protein